MALRTTVRTAPAVVHLLLASAVLPLLAGCQTPQAEVSRRLVAHVAMIDFSGLAPAKAYEKLDVLASIPRTWEAMPPQGSGLYTHQQWRSRSRGTGVGVVYVHLPLPFSAKTLVWLGKAKYNQAKTDETARRIPGGPGRLLGQWGDPLGREWFEVENAKYHVKGYVVTSGFDAWVVYSGFRLKGVPDAVDLDLAGRCVDSVVPLPLAPQAEVPEAP